MPGSSGFSKEHCDFIGWKVNGSILSAGNKLTVDYNQREVTAEAQWAEQYHITYVVNSPYGTISKTDEYVSTLGEGTALPTGSNTYYFLKGWSTSSAGEIIIGAGGATYRPTSENKEITLYAIWQGVQFTAQKSLETGRSLDNDYRAVIAKHPGYKPGALTVPSINSNWCAGYTLISAKLTFPSALAIAPQTINFATNSFELASLSETLTVYSGELPIGTELALVAGIYNYNNSQYDLSGNRKDKCSEINLPGRDTIESERPTLSTNIFADTFLHNFKSCSASYTVSTDFKTLKLDCQWDVLANKNPEYHQTWWDVFLTGTK